MYKDQLIEDFSEAAFQAAFQQYFDELGIKVTRWEELFQEMNNDPNGKNHAYVRTTEVGEVVGFLQFTELEAVSWFFSGKLGFIREFWIAAAHRGAGHGRALLQLAEAWFANRDIPAAILTTDTAPAFYQKQGYRYIAGIQAKNSDPVYVKCLK